jgi:hypothetical protein
MRRLLLIIAGILILTAVAVPSAAVYYFALSLHRLSTFHTVSTPVG